MKRFAKFIGSMLSAVLAFNFAAPAVAQAMDAADNKIASLSETIKTGLQNYDPAIDISKFEMAPDQENLQRISEVMSYVRKMPEMFCVAYESNMKIQPVYAPDGSIILGQLKVTYTNTREEADALLEEVNTKIDSIVEENITSDMTELQKALNLHDYLVLNTVYDTEGTIPDRDDGASAYDILICGNGVCEGYAQAYNMLLDRVGISSIMVTSYDMNHAWNLVNIDNEWYHVDTTWDDPVPDAAGRVNHKYFLLSDAEISVKNPEAGRNYIHEKWDSKGIEATSTKYDHAFWQTVSTEIFTRGDQWYYVSGNGEYSRYTESTGEVDTFVSLCDENWYVWGQYSQYWTGKYISLLVSGDYVVFNTPTQLFRMNLDGSNKTAIGNYINPYETDGYVYGLRLKNDKIYAVIKQEPSDTGSLYEVMDISEVGLDNTQKLSFIESIADIIKAMPDGSSRSFEYKDTESILPAAAIDAMRNRNVSITLDLGDYSWDIKGSDVSADEAKDLNLEIKKDQGEIPDEMIATVSRKNSTVVELDLQHEGDFGLKANINYTLGEQFINNIAVLYRYNQLESKLDKVDNMLVDSNGNLQIDLDQSSSYAIVLRDLSAPEEPIIEPPVKPPQAEETTAVTPAETSTPAVTTAPAVTTVPETTTVSETTLTTVAATTAQITSSVEVTDPVQTTAATTAAVLTETEPTPEVTEVTTTAQAEQLYKKGDINGDGIVDLSDLTLLALYNIGDVKFTDIQVEIADVTGDGCTDLADLARVKQFLMNVITEF